MNVQKMELPMLRRDPGGVRNRRNRWQSMETLRNQWKTMKKDETLMQRAEKWWKNAENRWNLMKMMKLNDQLSQDCRSHTSKTQGPPLKGVTCGRDRQSLPFLRVRPPHCGIAHPPLMILDELLWSKRAYDLGRCIVKKVRLSKLLVNGGVVLLGGVCLIPWASALNG